MTVDYLMQATGVIEVKNQVLPEAFSRCADYEHRRCFWCHRIF